MLRQNRRPLYDHLNQHGQREVVRYHIPGHHGGQAFELPYWQDIAKWDVTETYEMDDLHSPDGPILESELLAAEAFGAKKTYFLVNGSSSGLLAAIHSAFQHGDQVLVQRNAHKSIYNAFMLRGIDAVYMLPEIVGDSIAGVVKPDTLQEAIANNPQAKGVILTSPTFYGHGADLESIVAICKKNNLILIVDEAHGAHYSFHPALRKSSALLQGADLVIQSIHKTLPALTMGSMLHVGNAADGKIDRERLSYYTSVFQTTSPSYLVMASLDFARHWMVEHGTGTLDNAYRRKKRLIEQIASYGLRSYDEEWIANGYANDPLKLTIDISRTSLSGRHWERRLAKEGIFIELVNPKHILLVVGLTLSEQDDDRFLAAIERILKETKEDKEVKDKEWDAENRQYNSSYRFKSNGAISMPAPSIAMPFSTISREIQQFTTEKVDLQKSEGRVAAEFIVPYPPGIPILCPGEVIKKEHIQFIMDAKDAETHFQGIVDKTLNTIKCFNGRI